MPGNGIDRRTGAVLSGYRQALQSLEVIFTTRIGSRVMRRLFGSAVPPLLGQNATPAVLLRFYTAIAIAIDLWEPRFRLRRVTYPDAGNGPLRMRQGKFGIEMDLDYRPRALEGDFTVEAPESGATRKVRA